MQLLGTCRSMIGDGICMIQSRAVTGSAIKMQFITCVERYCSFDDGVVDWILNVCIVVVVVVVVGP